MIDNRKRNLLSIKGKGIYVSILLLLIPANAFVAIVPFHFFVALFYCSVFYFMLISGRGKISVFFNIYIIYIFLIFIINLDTIESVKYNTEILVRFIFPFFIYFILVNIDNNGSFFSKKNFVFCFRMSYLGVFASLLLGVITGKGGTISRGYSAIGITGFFMGANEIGLILIVLLLYFYSIHTLLSKKETIFFLICICISGVAVFTKSSLIASLLSIYLICFLFKKIQFLLVFVLIISINKVVALAKYLLEETFFSALSTNLISFFFRGREGYYIAFFDRFEFSFNNIIKIIFTGFGDYYIIKKIALGIGIPIGGRYSFEMDLFDLVFNYGIVASIVYILFLFKIIYRIQKRLGLFSGVMLIVVFLHSMLAGHVVFSIQITGAIVFFYVFLQKVPEMFISKNNKY